MDVHEPRLQRERERESDARVFFSQIPANRCRRGSLLLSIHRPPSRFDHCRRCRRTLSHHRRRLVFVANATQRANILVPLPGIQQEDLAVVVLVLADHSSVLC